MNDPMPSWLSCYFFCYSEHPKPARLNHIKVKFRVLVSEDILDDPKDKVLIMFGLKDLGGWKNYDHVMTFVRYTCSISFLLNTLKPGFVTYSCVIKKLEF